MAQEVGASENSEQEFWVKQATADWKSRELNGADNSGSLDRRDGT